MQTVERTERWRPSTAFAVCASGVVLGYLVGGFAGAFGAFVLVIGIVMVRRGRARDASIPKTACFFVVLGQGDQAVAAMLFRPYDGDVESAAEHLRGHGWGVLEPPWDGPFAPVRRVGVEFRGDRSLVVLDLHGVAARASLVADRMSGVPHGWGRAAQQSGYVLLLLHDHRLPLEPVPTTGAYALLRGVRRAA